MTNVNPIRIRWAERVPPHKIRRLYESDARGLLDEELLDDVGYGIYLIHEFHIHYRAVGTPIGCDVIKATVKELIELIESLAYGPGSTGGVERTKEIWSSRLRAKRMKVDLQAIARELGIQGFSRMRKRALIEAIERADPQRFEAWIRLVHGADQNSSKGDK